MTQARLILVVAALAAGVPLGSLAQATSGVPVQGLSAGGLLKAYSEAGEVGRSRPGDPGEERCGRPLTTTGLPQAISLCLGPEPAGFDLPHLVLWNAASGEQPGSDLPLQPVSVKLDAWPGGDAGPRELGLAAADGIRLDDGASKLVRQTAYLATIGVMVIGGLIAAPQSVSKWDTSNPARFIGSMPANWSEHVSQGPVVDSDKWAINYIGHPISGSFYYQVARNDGFGVIGSTIYSAAMSGLFWEFGIEAMAEVPSTQDLIVTPLGGALLGEAFYQVDQAIDRGGGTVLGSRVLGGISKFLLNPAGSIVDGIDATVVGSPERPASGSGLSARSALVAYPMSYPGRPELRGNYVGLQMIFTLP